VRQREEHDVVTGQYLRRRLLHHTVGELHELGLVLPQQRTRTLTGRDGTDLDFGMGEQQA